MRAPRGCRRWAGSGGWGVSAGPRGGLGVLCRWPCPTAQPLLSGTLEGAVCMALSYLRRHMGCWGRGTWRSGPGGFHGTGCHPRLVGQNLIALCRLMCRYWARGPCVVAQMTALASAHVVALFARVRKGRKRTVCGAERGRNGRQDPHGQGRNALRQRTRPRQSAVSMAYALRIRCMSRPHAISPRRCLRGGPVRCSTSAVQGEHWVRTEPLQKVLALNDAKQLC